MRRRWRWRDCENERREVASGTWPLRQWICREAENFFYFVFAACGWAAETYCPRLKMSNIVRPERISSFT
jgi:hypothetical protein